MKTNTIVIIILAIVIALAISLILNNTDDDGTNTGTPALIENFEGPSETPPVESSSVTEPVSDNVSTTSGGTYIAYAENTAREAAQEGDAVLFFHASWCPTCRSLNRKLNQESADIPEGLTILKTDYDGYSDLKRKYGVQYQHTLVLVDENLNLIKRWSGSRDLGEILNEL